MGSYAIKMEMNILANLKMVKNMAKALSIIKLSIKLKLAFGCTINFNSLKHRIEHNNINIDIYLNVQ
jgi:hypothetical protein